MSIIVIEQRVDKYKQKKNRRRELCFTSEKLTGEEKKRGGKRREKGER